jgi:hypothetical protein
MDRGLLQTAIELELSYLPHNLFFTSFCHFLSNRQVCHAEAQKEGEALRISLGEVNLFYFE